MKWIFLGTEVLEIKGGVEVDVSERWLAITSGSGVGWVERMSGGMVGNNKQKGFVEEEVMEASTETKHCRAGSNM